MRPGKVPCPECGRDITTKADGTMRHHTDQRKPKVSTIFSPRCDGSDKYPSLGEDES